MPYLKRQCKSFLIACAPPLVLAAVSAIASHIIHPTLLLLSAALVLDAGSRYREHIRLFDLLNSGLSPTPRVLRKASLSWCRRHAAIAAGVHPQVFHDMGYRWYHIFPTGAPMCFFRPKFYKGVFS